MQPLAILAGVVALVVWFGVVDWGARSLIRRNLAVDDPAPGMVMAWRLRISVASLGVLAIVYVILTWLRLA